MQRLVLILVAVIALAACSPAANNVAQQAAAPTSTPIPTAPAVARPTYLVQRGDVQEILDFPARWQPRDQMQLSFEINGTVRRVNVKRNDTVTAGQLLADFQITDLENQLASAQLDLESAQTALESGTTGSVQSVADAEIALANARLDLNKTKGGSPWTDLVSAKNGLESAKQDLENAQRSYDEAISHPDSNAATVDNAYSQLQKAKLGLRNAQNSYDAAAQRFNSYQYDIARSENNVTQAELNLQKARQGGGDASQQQQVRAAQLKIDQIQANIARSSLYAPIDGQILEVNIKPGDQADAFKTVIVIGKPEPKEAVASLAIGDAQKLSVGMVGVCQVLNRPETAVQCAVRQIPLSSRDADQTTRVAASLENVTVGQSIEVKMPLQVRQNVLWLPPAAVRTFQSRVYVVLQTPDGPRPVDVQIGLQTDDRVEIISGVNEGDVVEGP
jgi:HlyD family secretion protein